MTSNELVGSPRTNKSGSAAIRRGNQCDQRAREIRRIVDAHTAGFDRAEVLSDGQSTSAWKVIAQEFGPTMRFLAITRSNEQPILISVRFLTGTCTSRRWLDHSIKGAIMHVEPDPQSTLRKEPLPRGARDRNGRPWTAVEKYRLRGLIDRQQPRGKIARTLKRPVASVIAMATRLGLPV